MYELIKIKFVGWHDARILHHAQILEQALTSSACECIMHMRDGALDYAKEYSKEHHYDYQGQDDPNDCPQHA